MAQRALLIGHAGVGNPGPNSFAAAAFGTGLGPNQTAALYQALRCHLEAVGAVT
jgi:hypothetical protein